MYIVAYLGSRDKVNAAVSQALARNPNWWVADTRDWGREKQLVASPEDLLLRLSSVEQLKQETEDTPGLVIAAVAAGSLDRETWCNHLGKIGARIVDL